MRKLLLLILLGCSICTSGQIGLISAFSSSWLKLARTHYNRVKADGGTIDSTQSFNFLKDYFAIKHTYNDLIYGIHPSIFGYKEGTDDKYYNFNSNADATSLSATKVLLNKWISTDGNYYSQFNLIINNGLRAVITGNPHYADLSTSDYTYIVKIEVKNLTSDILQVRGTDYCITLGLDASGNLRVYTKFTDATASSKATTDAAMRCAVGFKGYIRVSRNWTTGTYTIGKSVDGINYTEQIVTDAPNAGKTLTTATYIDLAIGSFYGTSNEHKFYNFKYYVGSTLFCHFDANRFNPVIDRVYCTSETGENWEIRFPATYPIGTIVWDNIIQTDAVNDLLSSSLALPYYYTKYYSKDFINTETISTSSQQLGINGGTYKHTKSGFLLINKGFDSMLQFRALRELYEKYFYRTTNPIYTTTIITVSKTGMADYVGNNAIQDAIDAIADASYFKRYKIIVKKGTYTATQVSDYTKEFAANIIAFIMPKSYITIEGEDKDSCIINCSLPNNLGSSFHYEYYQPVMFQGATLTESYFKNLTIYAENLRYAFHVDLNFLNPSFSFLENMYIEHKGNSGDALDNPTPPVPVGTGFNLGQTFYNKDLYLKSAQSSALMFHDPVNTLGNATLYQFENCTLNGTYVLDAQFYNSSNYKMQYVLKNCVITANTSKVISLSSYNQSAVNQRADHVTAYIITEGMIPLAVKNYALRGLGLKITSKSTGANSSVRFDRTSTAFPLIIGFPLETTAVKTKYNYNQQYGYVYNDGLSKMSGVAIGLIDVDSGLVAKKLGVRLGDCSSVNKVLGITIDGTSYTVTFNKDYTAYTNSQVLAEITAVVGSVATVGVECLGGKYYPDFQAYLFNRINNDTTIIQAGMGVIISGSNIRRALNSDGRIDGICLDNVDIGGTGRVITAGYIYSGSTTYSTFFAKMTTPSALSVGNVLGIDPANPGQFKVNQSPTLLECTESNIIKIK